jgi:hypothetical protein
MRALEHGEYIVRNDAGPIVSRDHFDLRSAEIAAARIGGHTRVEPCLRVTEYTVEILNGMGWCPLGRYASLEKAVREHLVSPHFGFKPEVADALIDRWYEMVGKTASPKTTALSKDAARVELKRLRAPGSAYWDTRSPQHRNTRARVAKLYDVIYNVEEGE